MAQPSQIVPTVTLNVAGTKQQVNLRDYLNVRVAPFLKRAVHDSLEAEPQYPLQWLGEHLIQQSILYEGNPDASNIRERFVYNHDAAAAAAKSPGGPEGTPHHTMPSDHQQQQQQQQETTTVPPAAVNGTSTPTAPAAIASPQNQDQSLDTEMGGTL